MENEEFQEGGLGLLDLFATPALFGSLISCPVGVEGQLTGALHVDWQGFHPLEMFAVIQLLPLKDHFVAPSPGFDPLRIVIKVMEMVPMDLLVEVIEFD